MSNDFVVKTIDKTRREVLMNVRSVLEDYALLREVAGQNALLDCTLYLLAKDNPKLLKRLNKIMSTEDLLLDINHINKNVELKKTLQEKMEVNNARF